MQYYQSLVLFEKQEKQDYARRMTPKKHKFSSLKPGITASMIRRQIGWSDKTPPKQIPTIIASEASGKVDELPANIFTQPVNLKAVTTLKQRLRHPATQPYTVNKLFPEHKGISIKRSLRCKQCEHNVIKPEFNPPSIKYRIQLFASSHMPEVRLVREPRIIFGQSFSIQLKLTNPTLQDMTVTLLELPSSDEESLLVEELRKSFEKSVAASSSIATTPTSSLLSSPLSLSRQASIIEEELRPVGQITNASVVLPEESFVINYRDDTAEFDDIDQIKKEELKFIVWRRSNRVIIELLVNPNTNETININDEIFVGFMLQYTYVNTVSSNVTASGTSGSTAGANEKEKHVLNSRVYIKLGKAKLSDD